MSDTNRSIEPNQNAPYTAILPNYRARVRCPICDWVGTISWGPEKKWYDNWLEAGDEWARHSSQAHPTPEPIHELFRVDDDA